MGPDRYDDIDQRGAESPVHGGDGESDRILCDVRQCHDILPVDRYQPLADDPGAGSRRFHGGTHSRAAGGKVAPEDSFHAIGCAGDHLECTHHRQAFLILYLIVF